MSDPEPKKRRKEPIPEPIPEKSGYFALSSKQLFIAIILIISFIVCVLILILFIVMRFWDKSEKPTEDESEEEEEESEDVADILNELEAEILVDEEEVKNARAERYSKEEPRFEVLDDVSSSAE